MKSALKFTKAVAETLAKQKSLLIRRVTLHLHVPIQLVISNVSVKCQFEITSENAGLATSM